MPYVHKYARETLANEPRSRQTLAEHLYVATILTLFRPHVFVTKNGTPV